MFELQEQIDLLKAKFPEHHQDYMVHKGLGIEFNRDCPAKVPHLEKAAYARQKGIYICRTCHLEKRREGKIKHECDPEKIKDHSWEECAKNRCAYLEGHPTVDAEHKEAMEVFKEALSEWKRKDVERIKVQKQFRKLFAEQQKDSKAEKRKSSREAISFTNNIV